MLNLAFVPLFKTYPFVEIPSMTSVLPVIAAFGSHLLWIEFFHNRPYEQLKNLTLASYAGFYLIFVWSVPISFFISMIPADEALPTSFGKPGTASLNTNLKRTTSSGPADSIKKGGIFRRIVDMFVKKQNLKESKTESVYAF